MATVIESEMKFGDYPEENFFKIENSDLHKSVGAGIKSVEFILFRGDKLLFVEAKSNLPNINNRMENEEKKKNYNKYYSDITDKFTDSFNMFLSWVVKSNNHQSGIGTKIKSINNLSNINIRFVFVIRKVEDKAWLTGPKEELEERLKKLKKIWKVKVVVLNEKLAMDKGLIKD